MTRRQKSETHIQYHKDESVWARGQVIDGVPAGYWEWFRRDGSRMRSGHFEGGVPVGTWTTYDQSGSPYKVTERKGGTGRR